MAMNINHTAEEIYTKEFHVDVKGYSPAEVDGFLDGVIEDYQTYDEKIEELNEAVKRYEEKIKELQQELVVLRSDNDKYREKIESGVVANGNNSDQVDILQRISRLEDAVFRGRNNYRGKKPHNKNRRPQPQKRPETTEE